MLVIFGPFNYGPLWPNCYQLPEVEDSEAQPAAYRGPSVEDFQVWEGDNFWEITSALTTVKKNQL